MFAFGNIHTRKYFLQGESPCIKPITRSGDNVVQQEKEEERLYEEEKSAIEKELQAKCDKAIEECEREYQNDSNYVIEQSSYLKSEMEENKRSHERHLCKIRDKFSICATKMWQAPAILIRLYP